MTDAGNLDVASAVEQFLVSYVIKRRNPLSVTAAILRAIQDEIAHNEESV